MEELLEVLFGELFLLTIFVIIFAFMIAIAPLVIWFKCNKMISFLDKECDLLLIIIKNQKEQIELLGTKAGFAKEHNSVQCKAKPPSSPTKPKNY